jgi:hypothetical protein
MSGYDFAGADYAHKFFCLDSAKYILDDVNAKEKKAFMTWHDESKDAKEFYGSWGEVSQNYLETLG